MTIIACTDVSIYRDVDGSHHVGIGIVFYAGEISEECLLREISLHQHTTIDHSPQMEWHAIYLAIRQVIQDYENTSVLCCCDCAEAVRRWQKIANCPPAKHKALFKRLEAQCISVGFRHARRSMVSRAHRLAKCAATSQMQTAAAENTRRQLLTVQKPCLPACGTLEMNHADQEGHDTNR